MSKVKWILIFFIIFLVVFFSSVLITFKLVIDKDGNVTETGTEAAYDGGALLFDNDDEAGSEGEVAVDDEFEVTKVTPGLSPEDAVILRGRYEDITSGIYRTNETEPVYEQIVEEDAAATDNEAVVNSGTEKNNEAEKAEVTAKPETKVQAATASTNTNANATAQSAPKAETKQQTQQTTATPKAETTQDAPKEEAKQQNEPVNNTAEEKADNTAEPADTNNSENNAEEKKQEKKQEQKVETVVEKPAEKADNDAPKSELNPNVQVSDSGL